MDPEEKAKILSRIKKKLPENWIVQFSNKYEDRVFYFNKVTGTTTWEYPEVTRKSKKHAEKVLESSSNIDLNSTGFGTSKQGRKLLAASTARRQHLNKNHKKIAFSIKSASLLKKTSLQSVKLTSPAVNTDLTSGNQKKKRKRNYRKRKSSFSEASSHSGDTPSCINSTCNNSSGQLSSKLQKSAQGNLQHNLSPPANTCNKPEVKILSNNFNSVLKREAKLNTAERQEKLSKHAGPIIQDFTEETFVPQWTNPLLEGKVVSFPKVAKLDVEMLDVSLTDNSKRVADSQKVSNSSSIFVYIIIDTNVFLSPDGLEAINTIVDWFPLPPGQFYRAIAVVPWIVLQELDHLKTNSKSAVKARRAVAFLNRQFSSGKPGIRGQTIIEAASLVDGMNVEMNDDRILQCCFFFSHLPGNHKTILFSKDSNLCNKAMINHFASFTSLPSLIEGITNVCKSETPQYDVKLTSVTYCDRTSGINKVGDVTNSGSKNNDNSEEKISTRQADLSSSQELIRQGLAEILESEMKKAYGDIWQEIVLKKPPWSLLDVLYCIRKHWLAVFSMLGMDRLHLTQVESLLDYLKRDSSSSLSKHEFKAYTSYSSREEFLSASIQLIAGLGRQNLTPSIKSTLQKLRILLKSKEGNPTHGVNPSRDVDDARGSGKSSECESDSMLDVEEFIGNPDDSVSAESCFMFWQTLDKIWESILLHSVAIFKSLNFAPSSVFNPIPPELQQQLNSESNAEVPKPELSVQVIPLLEKLIENLLNALKRFLLVCQSQSGAPSLPECLDLLQTLWTITQALTIETDLSSLKPVVVQHSSKNPEDQEKLYNGYQKLLSVAGVLKNCSTQIFNHCAS